MVDYSRLTDTLFPWLDEQLGELTQKQQELVTTLEMIRIEEFILSSHGFPDRPPKDRGAIARAYIAKMVYNMPTTRLLLDRLKTDISLRRICGWERVSDIPEEWTFSRAFAGFSNSQLPERVHESFIKKHYKGEIVGHNSRDSTLYAIELFKSIGGAGGSYDKKGDVQELLREWKQDSAKLLQRFDFNEDGEIDMDEWQAVMDAALREVEKQHGDQRTLPAIHTMIETHDKRRPYMLSAYSQEDLLKRYHGFAVLGLIAFLTAGPLVTWILIVRLAFS